MVGVDPSLQEHIIHLFHDSPLRGHSRATVTTKKIVSMFYWKKLRKDVRNFIRSCSICQRCKPLLQAYSSTLQPLLIPEAGWVNISLDFVEGFAKV